MTGVRQTTKGRLQHKQKTLHLHKQLAREELQHQEPANQEAIEPRKGQSPANCLTRP